MSAKALLLLALLAACPALTGADRSTLVVAHSAHFWQSNASTEGNLDYNSLGTWGVETLSQVDNFTSQVGSKLEPSAEGVVSESNRYASMLGSLGNGFGKFRSAIDDFRAANRDSQDHSNEEVREMLRSARSEAGDEAAKEVHTHIQPVKEREPTVPHPAKVEPIVAQPAKAEPAVAHETAAPLHSPSHEDDPLSSPAAKETSAEAEKLVGHTAKEVKNEDAVEEGSVVRKETSEEAKSVVGSLEQAFKKGGEGNGEFTGDTQAAEEAVKKLVREEEAQQRRVTEACFALADSPLKSDRRCNSKAVDGMFDKDFCAGHEADLKVACSAASTCDAKHVCVQGDDVVKDADQSWQVSDSESCSSGEARVVCVPKSGDFRLPLL